MHADDSLAIVQALGLRLEKLVRVDSTSGAYDLVVVVSLQHASVSNFDTLANLLRKLGERRDFTVVRGATRPTSEAISPCPTGIADAVQWQRGAPIRGLDASKNHGFERQDWTMISWRWDAPASCRIAALEEIILTSNDVAPGGPAQ